MTRDIDDPAREQAEHWFARLREPTLSESDRAAFERWRRAHPDRAEAYAKTEALWHNLAQLKQSQRLRHLLPDSLVSGEPRRSAWRYPPSPHLWGCALAAAMAIATVLLFYVPGRAVKTQSFATALGEQRAERLPDGTSLRLNTNSKLDLQFTRHQRAVSLQTGEAVFDVAKDASRPFVVNAGDGTITAVGTHFEVRRDGNTVSVTLIEGRVRVARATRSEAEWLAPGQQATFVSNTGGIVTRNVDVEALTSWTSGRLEFRRVPLAQAVDEANRYSARKIRLGDPAIGATEISGTFRAGDIDGFAAGLEAAFPLRIENHASEILLWSRDSKPAAQ